VTGRPRSSEATMADTGHGQKGVTGRPRSSEATMAEPPAASASRPSDFSGDYVDAPMESTHLRLPRTSAPVVHTPAPYTCTRARDTSTCRPATTEACPPVYVASHRLVARRLATGLVSLRLRVHNVRLTKFGPLRALTHAHKHRPNARRCPARVRPLLPPCPLPHRPAAAGVPVPKS
jgi:hypothetical protein